MTKTTEPHDGTKNLPQQSSTSNSTSNSTHSSSCCSSSSPLSSPYIQFQQQQCQKDPYLQNLTMKSQLKRKRNPLSDCTNTSFSSVLPKLTKFKPSSSSPLFKKVSINKASNPSFSPSLLTPLPKELHTPETADLEASKNISIAYGRRYSSNKRNDKEKESGIPTSSVPSKSTDKDEASLSNSEPIEFQQQCQKASGKISIDYGRRYSSNKRNDKEQESGIPTSSVPSKSTDKDEASLSNSEPIEFQQQCQKASGNISIAYGRRYSLNKRNDNEKELGIPTSSVPSKSTDKDEASLANSEPIEFQQQCQSERKRKLTCRSPFSDCTNTSSSSVPFKSPKLKPSSSPVFKNFSTTWPSTTLAVNLDDVPNPRSSPSTFLSTPLPSKLSTPEIVDLKASGTISVVYGRRYSSNKRKDKENETVIPTGSSLHINANSEPFKMKDKVTDTVISASSMSMDTWKEAVIPGSSTPIKRKDKENEAVTLANSAPVKRKDKGKDTVISESSNFMDTWEKAVISDRSASIKRKDKGKECDIPSSTMSSSKVDNTREKSDGLERANPFKAKAFSVPCTKKHHAKSSKVGVLIKDYPDLQDYIKEQNAHFKEIDEFEMLVEEVD